MITLYNRPKTKVQCNATIKLEPTHLQFPPLFLTLALGVGALVLHANPKLVHFGKVLQHKVHGVLHGTTIALELVIHVGQFVLGDHRDVVAQEQTAHRVLYTLRHLHDVLQDVCTDIKERQQFP